MGTAQSDIKVHLGTDKDLSDLADNGDFKRANLKCHADDEGADGFTPSTVNHTPVSGKSNINHY